MTHLNYPRSNFLIYLFDGDDSIFSSQMCCEDQERKRMSKYFVIYRAFKCCSSVKVAPGSELGTNEQGSSGKANQPPTEFSLCSALTRPCEET